MYCLALVQEINCHLVVGLTDHTNHWDTFRIPNFSNGGVEFNVKC